MKFTSQAITLLALVPTIIGYSLLGDWQAIPYDPCTEYSPFHHPEMIQNGSIVKLVPQTHSDGSGNQLGFRQNSPTIKFSSRVQFTFNDGFVDTVNTVARWKLPCFRTETCLRTGKEGGSVINLNFRIDDFGNVKRISKVDPLLKISKMLQCHFPEALPQLCLGVYTGNVSLLSTKDEQSSTYAHIESLQVLPDDLYWTARNICMSANVTGRQCHWVPNSLLTKKDGEDCQPICRSLHQILTFPQFIIGLALLLLSTTLTFPSIAALMFNQVRGELQVS